MSLSQEEVDALLNGHRDRKQNGRNPHIKVGDFVLDGIEVKKIAETKTLQAKGGVEVEVELIKGYVFVFSVVMSSHPSITPGMKIDYYVRQNAAKEFAQAQDKKDLIAALASLMEYVGEDGKVVRATSKDVQDALNDPKAIAGFRVNLNTKEKQRKDDAPPLKDGQEPFLWMNWAPSGQTLADVIARKNALDTKAA